MHRRAFTVVWISAFLFAAHAAGAQQFAKVDAKCRKTIGLRVRKLSDTLLNEAAKCHRLRMQGKIAATTDCNDPTQVPGVGKVQKAESNLSTGTAKGCISAASPQQNGYIMCRPPCTSVPITDYFSVAECLKCVTEDAVQTTTTGVFSTPPAPADRDHTSCEGLIATALRKYFVTRMKAQQKCQYTEDQAPTGRDCMTNPGGKVSDALQRAQSAIAKCDPTLLGTLDSCGTTTADEQTCVASLTDQHSDDLFVAVYRPSAPTPTPTQTATRTRTPTRTPTPTPTNPPPASAIFVSSTVGSPSGAGTMASPVNSITLGIGKAVANSLPDVFIDGGTYAESITLVSGVNLFGGYSSGAGWTRTGATTVVNGSTTAVTGTSVSNVVIDGVTIHAAANSSAGASSYGIRLVNATSITIQNCTITAGSGGTGSGGANGANGSAGNNGGGGADGSCDGGCPVSGCGGCAAGGGGGGGGFSPCGNHGGTGGQGGNEDSCVGQTNGFPGSAGVNGGSGGGGGSSGNPGGGGGAGNPGSAGSNAGNGGGGVGGSAASGTWVGNNGGTGSSGTSGTGGGGGGGGGAQTCSTCNDGPGNGGGGGGAGGCGGGGGGLGTAGGGSFGVFLVNYPSVRLANNSVATGNGGAGGNGGVRGLGGAGGAGSPGAQTCTGEVGAGGNGGDGGVGGNGGHGGGGAGGPTIGIFCTVAGQSCSGNSVATGSPGTGGSSSGNAGSAGLKANSSGCSAGC